MTAYFRVCVDRQRQKKAKYEIVYVNRIYEENDTTRERGRETERELAIRIGKRVDRIGQKKNKNSEREKETGEERGRERERFEYIIEEKSSKSELYERKSRN